MQANVGDQAGVTFEVDRHIPRRLTWLFLDFNTVVHTVERLQCIHEGVVRRKMRLHERLWRNLRRQLIEAVPLMAHVSRVGLICLVLQADVRNILRGHPVKHRWVRLALLLKIQMCGGSDHIAIMHHRLRDLHFPVPTLKVARLLKLNGERRPLEQGQLAAALVLTRLKHHVVASR